MGEAERERNYRVAEPNYASRYDSYMPGEDRWSSTPSKQHIESNSPSHGIPNRDHRPNFDVEGGLRKRPKADDWFNDRPQTRKFNGNLQWTNPALAGRQHSPRSSHVSAYGKGWHAEKRSDSPTAGPSDSARRSSFMEFSDSETRKPIESQLDSPGNRIPQMERRLLGNEGPPNAKSLPDPDDKKAPDQVDQRPPQANHSGEPEQNDQSTRMDLDAPTGPRALRISAQHDYNDRSAQMNVDVSTAPRALRINTNVAESNTDKPQSANFTPTVAQLPTCKSDALSAAPTPIMIPKSTFPHDAISSVPASTNVTPRSAGPELDGISPDRLRSENFTPTARELTNGKSTLPDMLSNGYNESEKSSGSENYKTLFKHLDQFAQSVSKVAILSAQRELAKVTLGKKEEEYKHWKHQHGAFISLAEEQERDLRHAKNGMERLDERFKKYEESKNLSTQMLAKILLASGNGAPIPQFDQESTHVKRLGAELEEFKEFKVSMQKITSDLKCEVHTLRGYQSKVMHHDNQHKNTDKRLSKMEKELNDIRSRFHDLGKKSLDHKESILRNEEKTSRAQETLTVHGKRLNELQKLIQQYKSVGESVSDIQNKIVPLGALQAEVVKIQSGYSALNTTLNESSNDNIKNEHNILNFRETLMQQDTKVAKFEGAMMRFDRDLNAVSGTVGSLSARIVSLETHEPRDSNTQATNLDPVFVEFRDDIKQLKQEQEMKDDMVSHEVERLEGSLALIQNESDSMRQKLEEMKAVETSIEAIRQDLSKLADQVAKSPSANTSAQQFITSAPLSTNALVAQLNGADDLLNTVAQQPLMHGSGQTEFLNDHRQRLLACESTLLNLQQRFNNLTTESMARVMVNQMQAMYPYAAKVQSEIDAIKRKQITNTHVLQSHTESIAAHDTLKNAPIMEIQEVLDKLNNNWERHQSRIILLETQVQELSSKLNFDTLGWDAQSSNMRLEFLADIDALKNCVTKLQNGELLITDSGSSKLGERIAHVESARYEERISTLEAAKTGYITTVRLMQSQSIKADQKLEDARRSLEELQQKINNQERETMDEISLLRGKVDSLQHQRKTVGKPPKTKAPTGSDPVRETGRGAELLSADEASITLNSDGRKAGQPTVVSQVPRLAQAKSFQRSEKSKDYVKRRRGSHEESGNEERRKR